MSRLNKSDKLTRLDVVYAPDHLQQGVLYVSEKYKIALHLCACGCGVETVTPLGENYWTLNGMTMRPSIGNQQFPCQSHYYITDGEIEWL